MADTLPPYPSLQYFFRALTNKLTGKQDQTLWDMLSPGAKEKIAPDFQRILAMIPADRSMPSVGAGAQYTSIPQLPQWLDKGKASVDPRFELPPGEAAFANVDPGMTGLDTAVIHEGLHAYNYLNKTNPKEALANISPDTRTEIVRRANWGHFNPDIKVAEAHVDPDEAVAYGGMYGPGRIPKQLIPLFKNIYKQPIAVTMRK